MQSKKRPPKKKRPDTSAEAPEQTARRLALGMLARREHAFEELVSKLVQRGLDRDVAEIEVGKLQEANLQSDDRFTEQFVRLRIERGDGPLKIRVELQRRGVKTELIQREMDATETDWKQLAEIARKKRFGEEIPAEYAERARQARFLQGRGFGMDHVRHVLKGEIADD